MMMQARNTFLTMLLLAVVSFVVVKGVEVVHDAFETSERMPVALRGIDDTVSGLKTVKK